MMATIAQMQREAARAEVARQRAQAAAQRDAERTRLAYARAHAADERERKRLYAESRTAEVAATNERLGQRLEELDSVLVSALGTDPYLDVEGLKQPVDVPPFEPGPLAYAVPVPRLESFLPSPQTGMSRLLGGARHEERVRQGQANYERACAGHAQQEQARREALAQAEAEYRQRVTRAEDETRRQHAEVDDLRRNLDAGHPDAVVAYLDLVLTATPDPDGFPQQWRMAYVPESQQLVVEFELPGLGVIPTVKAYRYIKTSDSVNESARSTAQVKAQYTAVVSQVALRVVNDIFNSDRRGQVGTVVFNGMVSTTDAATGQPIRPCLLSLRTTRERFSELDLARVDPAACLRHLGAGVSRSPAELTPVRPVLEFNMVDPRFIEETDVLGDLDQRPNLLELSPTEFESLIQNLFSRMGLETRQTRASRDGGVDCVAYDPRPIMGGKVVIQAKRYRNTVGVSAVRDLYGTLQNEGASKGILVTTSGYGQASFDFAKNKPIELLDGANLLHLLQEHAGIEARIVAPDDWSDPAPDAAESRVGSDAEHLLLEQPTELKAGQNIGTSSATLIFALEWNIGLHDLDLCALLLGEDGRVRSDNDFVFYNQEVSPDGSVRHFGKADAGTSARERIEIDTASLDTAVTRIILAASVDGDSFGSVPNLRFLAQDGAESHIFSPSPTTETALVCAELYRRQGKWRLRAIGQGYDDGLAGLARDYGVDIS